VLIYYFEEFFDMLPGVQLHQIFFRSLFIHSGILIQTISKAFFVEL
jgi:hypothetical protein